MNNKSKSVIETVLKYVEVRDELNTALTSFMRKAIETALKNNLSIEGVYKALEKKVNDETVIKVSSDFCIISNLFIVINKGIMDNPENGDYLSIKEDYEKYFEVISYLYRELDTIEVSDETLDPLYKLTGYSFEMIKQLISSVCKNDPDYSLCSVLSLKRKYLSEYKSYSTSHNYDICRYKLSNHVGIVRVQKETRSISITGETYWYLDVSEGITSAEIKELTGTVEKLIATLLENSSNLMESLKSFTVKSN